jgi:hypothetical protein
VPLAQLVQPGIGRAAVYGSTVSARHDAAIFNALGYDAGDLIRQSTEAAARQRELERRAVLRPMVPTAATTTSLAANTVPQHGQDDNDTVEDDFSISNISLGPAAAMASDGLSGHLSPSLEVCFNVQVGAVATYLPPGLIVDGIREGPYITGDMHSIIPANDYKAQADAYGVLQVHADDAQVLTDIELDDLRFFNTRSILIFQAWDTFHACTSIVDILGVLEQMSRIDLSFLLVLHAAYANYDVNFKVTFGQAKQAFYSFAHQCKFQHGSFDTDPENTPVSSMRAEYLLARTVPQMLTYLSWHGVTVADLPFDINEERWNLLGAIPDKVHARFDLGVYISCTVANYLSTVYSDAGSRYQLLHNQLYMVGYDAVQGFRIAALDAKLIQTRAVSMS